MTEKNINPGAFDHYEVEPSAGVWDKIEIRLPVAGQKKRAWMMWGVAASVSLAMLISLYLSNNQKIQRDQVQDIPESGNGIKDKTTAKTDDQLQYSAKSADRSDQSKPIHESREIMPAGTSNPEQLPVIAGNNKIYGKVYSSGIKTEGMMEANHLFIPPGKSEGVSFGFIHIRKNGRLDAGSADVSFLSSPADSILPSKRNSTSRWQFSLLSSLNYEYRVLDFPASPGSGLSDARKEYLAENESGIETFSYDAQAGYSLNTHVSLHSGITYYETGQKRSESDIYLANVNLTQAIADYAISTSVGDANGNAQQFNQAFFDSPDSALFDLSASPTVAPNNSVTREFVLVQKFSFISIPFLIQYQLAERKFTPYMSLGFSAGMFVKSTVSVNDKIIDYDYSGQTTKTLFAAEAQAGVKYRIKNHLSLKLQPSLRYGLNSMNRSESVKWIPYSVGIGFGLQYRY